MIPIQNIYYMLSYAFRVLNQQGYKKLVKIGTKEGSSKTTKGTPDSYFKTENGKYFTNQDLIFQIQRYLTEKIDFTKIFSSKICISGLRLSIDRDKYHLFWDCV